MSIPDWMAGTSNSVVHSSAVLRQAARALREDARVLRAAGFHTAARAAMMYSAKFEAVASGKTWLDAFSLRDAFNAENDAEERKP